MTFLVISAGVFPVGLESFFSFLEACWGGRWRWRSGGGEVRAAACGETKSRFAGGGTQWPERAGIYLAC